MADLLLVNPLFLKDDPVESKLMTPYFPLGLLYVASAAREAGYDVAIFDAMFATSDRDFSAALAQHRPAVVGFGVLATVRRAAFPLAALAKEHGALVVMGGADPTARPATYLTHRVDDRHVVDVVTVGESEETMLDLLAALSDGWNPPRLASIAGIAYRNEDGTPTETPRRALIEDVDAIPFPARDLVDYEPYREAWRRHHGVFSLSIIATRGCPFSCAWCQKAVFGRSFRPRSPESVAAEMAHIKQTYAPDFLRIVDDAMGIDKAWVRTWHDDVLEKDAIIPFECLSRVDLVDEEVVRLLREAGCQRIAFGAESGAQKVLDAMTKGITVEQIRRAARICREGGIETYFYMMVGYPGETWEDIQASVALLRETRPDAFSTTIAYPLPGTPFFEQVKHYLPDAAPEMPDWDYTAENRLLFEHGAYNTAFYRRVIRWFHHEWEYARLRSGLPVPGAPRWRTIAALWRDRALVRLLERFSRARR
jgi:anaerobic magnesium-protoporphyrin IX monomethyl ester cyclase